MLEFIFSNTIIAFIILIGIIIFIHELGHYLVGKFFKVKVEEFSIGFGPAAFAWKMGETLYRINWLPLGGYVRFYGANLEEDILAINTHRSLRHAKAYKRACIALAGPFANFILSFAILFGIISHGIPTLSTAISVVPHSIAEHAGLKNGDKILSIDDINTNNWGELVNKISINADKKLNFRLERNKQVVNLTVIPKLQNSETIYGTKELSGKIGISPLVSAAPVYIKGTSFVDCLQKAYSYLIHEIMVTYKGLKLLVLGHIPLSNLGGPISIATLAGQAAKSGLISFLFMISFISVNIGLVNLLPFPAFDGGTLLLSLVEMCYGKSLPRPIYNYIQKIGILIILLLFLIVFYNDILRLVK